jgi:hypothetical protein
VDAYNAIGFERSKITQYREAIAANTLTFDTYPSAISPDDMTYYLEDLFNQMRSLLARRDKLLPYLDAYADGSDKKQELLDELGSIYRAVCMIRDQLYDAAAIPEEDRPPMTDIATYDMTDVMALVFNYDVVYNVVRSYFTENADEMAAIYVDKKSSPYYQPREQVNDETSDNTTDSDSGNTDTDSDSTDNSGTTPGEGSGNDDSDSDGGRSNDNPGDVSDVEEPTDDPDDPNYINPDDAYDEPDD